MLGEGRTRAGTFGESWGPGELAAPCLCLVLPWCHCLGVQVLLLRALLLPKRLPMVPCTDVETKEEGPECLLDLPEEKMCPLQ